MEEVLGTAFPNLWSATHDSQDTVSICCRKASMIYGIFDSRPWCALRVIIGTTTTTISTRTPKHHKQAISSSTISECVAFMQNVEKSSWYRDCTMGIDKYVAICVDTCIYSRFSSQVMRKTDQLAGLQSLADGWFRNVFNSSENRKTITHIQQTLAMDSGGGRFWGMVSVACRLHLHLVSRARITWWGGGGGKQGHIPRLPLNRLASQTTVGWA